MNNMEKSGVLSADQSNYVWSVLLGYTAKDLPTYITSDGTTTRGLSKYPTYDSAVAAGADAKTTLSYVDFMRNLPSSRELQTVGSYNDYLEKQVNKNKKKQSSKIRKRNRIIMHPVPGVLYQIILRARTSCMKEICRDKK